MKHTALYEHAAAERIRIAMARRSGKKLSRLAAMAATRVEIEQTHDATGMDFKHEDAEKLFAEHDVNDAQVDTSESDSDFHGDVQLDASMDFRDGGDADPSIIIARDDPHAASIDDGDAVGVVAMAEHAVEVGLVEQSDLQQLCERILSNLFVLKVDHVLSESVMNGLLRLLHSILVPVLPTELLDLLPRSFKAAMTIVSGLLPTVTQYVVCPNECKLFERQTAPLLCPKCGASLFSTAGSPVRQYNYFPLIERLKLWCKSKVCPSSGTHSRSSHSLTDILADLRVQAFLRSIQFASSRPQPPPDLITDVYDSDAYKWFFAGCDPNDVNVAFSVHSGEILSLKTATCFHSNFCHRSD